MDLACIGIDFASREIPRPAGESAGLRNDAVAVRSGNLKLRY